MPVIQTKHSQHIGYLLQVYSLPVNITNKQQFGLGVIDNMNSIICFKILQNRHNNSAICHSSQINSHPITIILTHHGYLIILLNTGFLK